MKYAKGMLMKKLKNKLLKNILMISSELKLKVLNKQMMILSDNRNTKYLG